MLEGSKKSYYMYMVIFLHSVVGIHDLNNFFCQLYVVKLKYLGVALAILLKCPALTDFILRC